MDGAADGRSPLLRQGWEYVRPTPLDEFRAPDWALLATQRRDFDAGHQAAHMLRMLTASAADPSFGYQVNNYRHGLQAATAALQDGRDEDYVVVALFHDVAWTACPMAHGAVAAALLSPYISDAHRWLLEHHQIFQAHHCHDHPDEAVDPAARERWRGHPHFAATAEFVARYDVTTIIPGQPEARIAVFEPMLRRLLARPPRPIAPRED
jgi:predicted HD phosphohydrolase